MMGKTLVNCRLTMLSIDIREMHNHFHKGVWVHPSKRMVMKNRIQQMLVTNAAPR